MKPLLLIDAGNSWFKWASFIPGREMKTNGRIENAHVTPAWIKAFARKNAGSRCVIASVVPKVSRLLQQALPSAFVVRGDVDLPLAFAYPNPREIGADRLAAAIGAGPGPAIIISCGTATAFSVLDRRGHFCGGLIAPGLQTQLNALRDSTAQLPATKIASSRRVLGKSTQAAIRGGVLVGWQGGIVEIVKRLRREVGAKARVIVTGGEASHLHGVRELSPVEFRPLLVFEGLRIIADRLTER